MADLDSQWEFSTWFSRASVFLQLDDTGSTGMTIHRRTREEKTIYRSVTKVSRANQGDVGSNPAQGIKSFSSNENVIQGVVRPWSLLNSL